MEAIGINDLSKQYAHGKHKALDGLSLVLDAGMSLGLTGVNGAGKTTLLHVIAGLIEKDHGSLRLFGEEIHTGDYSCKRRVGFLLDRAFYFEKLTPSEYLEFVGGMYGLRSTASRQKTEELLAFFDLVDSADVLTERLSRGMKQKVSLAAAIIHEPELLILDEPFDGIDVPSAEAIRQILIKMNDGGVTVLITSHNLEIVETLCTECAIIDKGKIVFRNRMDAIADSVKKKEDSDGQLSPSLRDVFLQVTSSGKTRKSLSWLQDQ